MMNGTKTSNKVSYGFIENVDKMVKKINHTFYQYNPYIHKIR